MPSDLPQTLSPALPEGYLLKEYSLLSVLGMGAFGITYLAADTNLHLKVAVKEYFPSSAAVRNHHSGSVALRSEQAQVEYLWGKDRFMLEAQTLARFHHKNIVQVFRYFEGNGTCYMVMAYEEGHSLEDVLAENTNPWNEQSILALLMPLLDGLELVHGAGFLHRDIKPANIVLRVKDGSPVLIDFGAARSPTGTDAMTVVLSHGYGPPEQYSRQGNQGPWSDIYAMAGVLYRMVTGIVPPLSLHRIKHDVLIPAAFSGEGRFSAGFLDAIDRGLNVDETRRPQSIAEWRQLLTRGLPVEAGGATADDVRPATAAVGKAPPGPKSDRTSPPHKARISRHIEDVPEPGLFGRMGQAMIAHPFLTLLLLMAGLAAAIHYSRRPATPSPQSPQAVSVTSSNSAVEPVRIPAAPVQSGSAHSPPADPRPRPAETTLPPPGERSAVAADTVVPSERPNDSERPRVIPPPESFAACAGRSIGASCSFPSHRNDMLSGTCVPPPAGGPIAAGATLACRPERPGERGDRPPGVPPTRPNAEGFLPDNRARR